MSRWERIRAAALNFFEEKGIESDEKFLRSRLHRTAHFWLLVIKSFVRNRCPVRAASLAYTTLLALVPLLAVGVSITTSMLQKRGEEPVERFINKLVDYMAPALELQKESPNMDALPMDEAELKELSGFTKEDFPPTGRQRVVKQITTFIGNIRSGALGVTSVLALLFVGISLLRTIEATFNDIWGVARGRGMTDQ